MATKKMTKSSKRRLLIFGTISLVVIGYFCVSFVTYMYRLNYLQTEQKRLSANLAALQSKEENLKIEIQKLKDPDYVARYARENYLYTKDGEYVLKLEPSAVAPTPEDKKVEDYTIIIIAGGVVLVIIIIYVISKGRKKKKKS